MVSFILPGNSASGGFDVANSCRFDRGSTDFLNKTLGTPTNVDKATFSTWVKFTDTSSGNDATLFGVLADGNNTTYIQLLGSKVIRLNMRESTSYIGVLTTNRVFRDPSAWYHIVVAFDTTQGTDSNRIKLYINGVQETSFSTATYPSQNTDLRFNTSGQVFNIGRRGDSVNLLDGYLAETVFIDGQQLTPTSFGEFDEDSGIWKPIDVSGLTFGNNGFYLDYEDSGNLGNDKNGGTDLTVNNLTAIDQTTDTCTNNFSTMNPLDLHFTNDTLSEGNLLVTNGANYGFPISTFGLSSGKWYFECQTSSWTSGDLAVGISARGSDAIGDEFSNNTGGGKGYGFRSNGGVYGNSATIVGAGGYTTGSGTHIIGMALNLDDNKLAFSVNGTWQGSTDPDSGTTNMISIEASSTNDTGVYFIALSGANSGAQTMNANFGSPAFSISSGNADGNGYGNFEYAVPTGYHSICTKNLAEYG